MVTLVIKNDVKRQTCWLKHGNPNNSSSRILWTHLCRCYHRSSSAYLLACANKLNLIRFLVEERETSAIDSDSFKNIFKIIKIKPIALPQIQPQPILNLDQSNLVQRGPTCLLIHRSFQTKSYREYGFLMAHFSLA